MMPSTLRRWKYSAAYKKYRTAGCFPRSTLSTRSISAQHEPEGHPTDDAAMRFTLSTATGALTASLTLFSSLTDALTATDLHPRVPTDILTLQLASDCRTTSPVRTLHFGPPHTIDACVNVTAPITRKTTDNVPKLRAVRVTDLAGEFVDEGAVVQLWDSPGCVGEPVKEVRVGEDVKGQCTSFHREDGVEGVRGVKVVLGHTIKVDEGKGKDEEEEGRKGPSNEKDDESPDA